MAKSQAKTERLQVTLSLQTIAFLTLLSEKGTHGTGPTDVAKTLIEQGIRRAIRGNFLSGDDRKRVERQR